MEKSHGVMLSMVGRRNYISCICATFPHCLLLDGVRCFQMCPRNMRMSLVLAIMMSVWWGGDQKVHLKTHSGEKSWCWLNDVSMVGGVFTSVAFVQLFPNALKP